MRLFPGWRRAGDRALRRRLRQPVDQRCAAEAAKYAVHPHIHPDDYLFRYLHTQKADPVVEYFQDGRKSADILADILFNIGRPRWRSHRFSLLDFASGYGMVARHFPVVLPTATLTTCDIHPEANAFNAAHLRSRTLTSALLPEDWQVSQEFDVVFALSFFSHVPGELFERWLRRLLSLVLPGGLLIFTTHGRVSFPVVTDDTVYFETVSEQQDLDTRYYGVAAASPVYVLRALKSAQGERRVKLTMFREGFWWLHQDLYVVAVAPPRQRP